MKKKIRNIDDLITVKNNFNMMNFIFYKEPNIIFLLLLLIFSLLFIISINNSCLRNIFFHQYSVFLYLILFMSLLFSGMKQVDNKIIKKMKEMKEIDKNIIELKIKWKWKIFLNPLSDVHKLNQKINVVFLEFLKKNYDFEKIPFEEIKKESKERKKILNKKKTILTTTLLKNGVFVTLGAILIGLFNSYHSNLMEIIVDDSKKENLKIIKNNLNEVFLNQLVILFLIFVVVMLFIFFVKIINDNQTDERLIKLNDIEEILEIYEEDKNE